MPLIPKVIYVKAGTKPQNNVAVEVALTYNDSYSEHIYSYVNNINTIEGGTHVAGFRRALTRVFKSYGDKQNAFEKAKVEIEGDDFREGLSAIISVKVPEPQFEGQTKTKLGNNEVSGIVDSTVARAITGLPGRKSQGSQKYHPESDPGRTGRGPRPGRPGNWCSVKAYSVGAVCQVNWPIVPNAIRNAANYTSWKGIPPAVRPSRAGTAAFRPSCR